MPLACWHGGLPNFFWSASYVSAEEDVLLCTRGVSVRLGQLGSELKRGLSIEQRYRYDTVKHPTFGNPKYYV